MNLSHSSISLYRECPLLYRFIAIDKFPQAPKPYFSFGQAIHKSLCYFYADSLFSLPSLRDLILSYRHNWGHKGYKDIEEEVEYYRLGLSILNNFHREESKKNIRPVAVEYRLQTKIDGIKISGYIDRIDRIDGGFEIIDYKTSKTPPSVVYLNANSQLAIYQIGVEEHLGFKVSKLSIYHLRSMSKISIPAHECDFLEKVKCEIREIGMKIEQGKFEPKLHEGCPCEFDVRCPYFSEKYEKENIADIIDEYGELKEKMKSEEKEIKELHQAINEYLDKKEIRQAFGERFSVTLNLIKGTNLKKDIRKIIDDNDLWDDIKLWLKGQGFNVGEQEQIIKRLNLRRRDV